MKKNNILLFWTICVFFSCESSLNKNQQSEDNTLIDNSQLIENCDTAKLAQPIQKDYKKELHFYLKDQSLNKYISESYLCRDGQAWRKGVFPMDSSKLLECLNQYQDSIYLYIPNDYYVQKPNGNNYIKFYMVNNSNDTILVPSLDSTIDKMNSSFSSTGKKQEKWYLLQKTNSIVDCGNSIWTLKLPPKYFIEANWDSYNLGMGDSLVDFRIEWRTENNNIKSNSIKLYLLNEQIDYLKHQEK